jgi:transposase
MGRKRYTEEFRAEAVRLMVMEGSSATEVSQKLGVNLGLVYKWKHAHLRDVGMTSNGVNVSQMAEELERVRKELAKANRINEILKKTVIYFAKDEQ